MGHCLISLLFLSDKARNGGRRSRSAAKPQSDRWSPKRFAPPLASLRSQFSPDSIGLEGEKEGRGAKHLQENQASKLPSVLSSFPKEELFGESFGFGLFGGLSMEDEAFGPLCAGDKEDTDFAFGWDGRLDALDVGVLACEGDAGADVDGILEHLEAVVEEEFPEGGGLTALVVFLHGEVKADK